MKNIPTYLLIIWLIVGSVLVLANTFATIAVLFSYPPAHLSFSSVIYIVSIWEVFFMGGLVTPVLLFLAMKFKEDRKIEDYRAKKLGIPMNEQGRKNYANYLFIAFVLIFFISFGLSASILSTQVQYDHPSFSSYECTLNISANSTAWIITVSNLKPDGPWNEALVHYVLTNETDDYLESQLIGNAFSSPSGYNVTFVNIENDNSITLSNGDFFIISKMGGTRGQAVSGDHFYLTIEQKIGNVSNIITLP